MARGIDPTNYLYYFFLFAVLGERGYDLRSRTTRRGRSGLYLLGVIIIGDVRLDTKGPLHVQQIFV